MDIWINPCVIDASYYVQGVPEGGARLRVWSSLRDVELVEKGTEGDNARGRDDHLEAISTGYG